MQAIAARSHAVTLLYPLQGEPEDWGPERGRRGSIPARGREEGNANAIGLQGRGVRPLRAQLVLLCPQRPGSLGSTSSLWVGDQEDLSSLFQSARVI